MSSEPFRLRLKIGAHEFEAEGDQETVERQFAAWREIIASMPAGAAGLPAASPAQDPSAINPVPPPNPLPKVTAGGGDAERELLRKIYKVENRTVSLTVSPDNEAEAALLIMLGQKLFRDEDQVTGAMVTDGLANTGYRVERADRVLNRFVDGPEAYVIKTGFHRAIRYRLNNPGYQRAMQLAKEFAATVP